ncbi:ABC transporter permease [Chlamydia trachomatis]|uniref:ABC transporter permease n=1 Tax=Chlamydia trachomatis TaxID=813 RepID=UPI0001D6360D|nr:ABC transporter permease [Chlamydia trachomatis]ADH18181.1 oligonucleotide transport system permease [Chlamydia trachomatis G/9768]ADH20029.1 oligonucleotide transport system permease [Chlamydia trachomatis G/11074]ADH97126.1 oligonucleotide transport system permease [Chlamydia trachomatis G/9301]
MKEPQTSYQRFFRAYNRRALPSIALKFFIGLMLIGIYAPLFASSKPILVRWHGERYFPLFRYLLFPGFYTKSIDLFFNVLMLTLPFFILGFRYLSGVWKKLFLGVVTGIHIAVFSFALSGRVQDPCRDELLKQKRAKHLQQELKTTPKTEFLPTIAKRTRTWESERAYMSKYEQLGMLVKAKYRKMQHDHLEKQREAYELCKQSPMPTLHFLEMKNETASLRFFKNKINKLKPSYPEGFEGWGTLLEDYRPYLMARARSEHALNMAIYEQHPQEQLRAVFEALEEKEAPFREQLAFVRSLLEEREALNNSIAFIMDKRNWIETESEQVQMVLNPLLSSFHWEDDAGGSREMNKYVHWWQLTRINRKDLLASLIFGIRIAIVVGGLGVSIALFIGIIVGLLSGYFGGKVDMLLSRVTEIWETMPMLFILMLVVAITQKKSLILDSVLLGCFGWVSISRYVRIETLKQRNLGYVLAATNLCYSHYHIMVHQILPNVIVPVISLLPFSMMAMISCEAGLTFLGLGEESSASWGNLLREGVTAFPSESAILWPPAIMLTLLLMAIAVIGDGIRDALDPKMQD